LQCVVVYCSVQCMLQFISVCCSVPARPQRRARALHIGALGSAACCSVL